MKQIIHLILFRHLSNYPHSVPLKQSDKPEAIIAKVPYVGNSYRYTNALTAVHYLYTRVMACTVLLDFLDIPVHDLHTCLAVYILLLPKQKLCDIKSKQQN